MNRRSFLKSFGAIAAAMAVPVDIIAKTLPPAWSATGVRWMSVYDIYRDDWVFRASVILGKKISETEDRITLDNPEQYDVGFRSATEIPSEEARESALELLRANVDRRLRELNG